MFLCCSIIPVVGNVLGVLPTWKYALDTDVYDTVLSELHQRRHAKAQDAEALN
jgi:Na+/melibiose symporter-like transporter